VTDQTEHRGPFEVLRFTASAVSVELGELELDGRFTHHQGRFVRQPVLVVEAGEDRLELSPVRARFDGDLWSSVYAVPLGALDGGSFALGLRGTLLDLPAPHLADEPDRFAALARETNTLRRRLDAAEADARQARSKAAAAAAGLDAAVSAAAAEAQAAGEQAAEARAAELEAAHAAAVTKLTDRAARAEATARELDDAIKEATARAQAAEARVTELEAARDELIARAEAAEAGAAEQDELVAEAMARAEAAESQAAELEAAAAVTQDEVLARAEARTRAARDAVEAADAGIGVLRGELAEERERSQAVIADLQARLKAGRPDDDAIGELGDDHPTETRELDQLAAPKPAAHLRPVEHEAPLRANTAAGPGLSPWFAVVALVLFAFVLLGLLFGFLG
jgi:DNA repair exonuclease SbcCD ATPase subunit